jgi:hypothetical protein
MPLGTRLGQVVGCGVAAVLSYALADDLPHVLVLEVGTGHLGGVEDRDRGEKDQVDERGVRGATDWRSRSASGVDLEPFQRCRSRARTAAEIDDIRFGLHRALRKIRHHLSRATPRSTGARAADSARLRVYWVGVRSRPGGRLRGVVSHGPAPM